MLPATHHKPRWVETMGSQHVRPYSEERSTEEKRLRMIKIWMSKIIIFKLWIAWHPEYELPKLGPVGWDNSLADFSVLPAISKQQQCDIFVHVFITLHQISKTTNERVYC